MSVAFILGLRQTTYDPGNLIRFHAAESRVRDAYQEASEATGIAAHDLLHNTAEGERAKRVVASVGLAAGMIGIHDVLVARGVVPTAIGGMSMGAMVGTALVNALSRPDLYRLLAFADEADGPDPDGPAQGCVGAIVPIGTDYESLYGVREGVWVAADFGMHESGAFRMLLLAGYQDALNESTKHLPKEFLVPSEEIIAPHCPLRQKVADKVAEYLKKVDIADPTVRMVSCLGRGTLTTASEIRDMLADNITSGMSLDTVSQEMAVGGTRLGIVLGPTLPPVFEYPFPVAYVDAPEDVDQIRGMALAAGVRL
jgi:[acyl-carrier-protein] S-malonyltransferase